MQREGRASRLAVVACPNQPGSQELAARLAVPLLAAPSSDYDWLLIASDKGLALVDTGHVRGRPLRIDLSRRVAPIRRGEPLRRAVGRGVTTVVDATAGLGADTCLLLAMGLDVVAIERSGALAALFEDALCRAAGQPRMSRLRFVHGDSRVELGRLPVPPDVVYIDPMYPEGRKPSVLPRRECRLLRTLVGADADAADLLEAARRHARRRVVVKRPLYAAPLAAAPAASHRGRQVRYDVYVAGC